MGFFDMYVNLTEIRAARPELLFTAASEFATLSQAIFRYTTQLRNDVRKPLTDGSWTGRANEVAVARFDGILDRWDRAEQRMSEVGTAVQTFATALESAQSTLDGIERTAAANGISIDADGSLNLIAEASLLSEEGLQLAALMDTLERQINQLRKDVTEADNACEAVFGAPESDDDGGGIAWSDWFGRLGNFSSTTSIIGAANQFLPGGVLLPPYPLSGGITLVTSGKGFADELGNFLDEDTRSDGFGGAAQLGKTAFNASSIAFAVNPGPHTAAAVLVSAAVWGGSNFLDTHWGTISDGWDTAWEFGEDTAGTARDAWDTGWETTGNAFGTALDYGGGVLDSVFG